VSIKFLLEVAEKCMRNKVTGRHFRVMDSVMQAVIVEEGPEVGGAGLMDKGFSRGEG